jgi:hypothetical protein
VSRLVSNEITTTLEMINTTHMGRARALEKGLDWALDGFPFADQDQVFVTIRVYKWVEGEDDEPPAPPAPQVVEDAIVNLEGGKK